MACRAPLRVASPIDGLTGAYGWTVGKMMRMSLFTQIGFVVLVGLRGLARRIGTTRSNDRPSVQFSGLLAVAA
jgi:hypothetical protein